MQYQIIVNTEEYPELDSVTNSRDGLQILETVVKQKASIIEEFTMREIIRLYNQELDLLKVKVKPVIR